MTDRLERIKDKWNIPPVVPASVPWGKDDVAWLVSEVERLRAEAEQADEEATAFNEVLQGPLSGPRQRERSAGGDAGGTRRQGEAMTDPLEAAFLRLRAAGDADEYVPTERVIDEVLRRLKDANKRLDALRWQVEHEGCVFRDRENP